MLNRRFDEFAIDGIKSEHPEMMWDKIRDVGYLAKLDGLIESEIARHAFAPSIDR